MKFRYIIMYIKGNWSEFYSAFGLPPWSDSLRPCYQCSTSPDELHAISGITPASCGGFQENSFLDYEYSCSRCEVNVLINRELYNRLKPILWYDKRDNGAHGIAVQEAGLPAEGIMPGMRLEPSEAFSDPT